jgi:uncharacterized DUF497 family protein
LYDWDDTKDREKRIQFGFGFNEVMALFNSPYYFEASETYPGQYRAIGYASNQVLVTVACEDRLDDDGNEITWLATFWKASAAERKKYEE